MVSPHKQFVVIINENNNNSDLDIISSAIDIMNESLIPAQIIINPVMTSIPSMPKKILNTNKETAINEDENLSTCAHKDDNVAYSSTKFDLHVYGLSNFIDSTERHDSDNYDNTTISHCAKENNATLHHNKENEFLFTTEKIVLRTSKLTCRKMKSRINHSSLNSEEIDVLIND